MSREILFKAKRTDNGEWVEGDLIHAPDGRMAISTEEDLMEVMPKTVSEFTGLTDKNGKKIFDGDIVKFLGDIGTVKFECGCFGITFNYTIDWEKIESNICPITGCDNALYACENDNFISLWEIYWNFNDEGNSVYTVEVIGNIFDNPKLLKEGAE